MSCWKNSVDVIPSGAKRSRGISYRPFRSRRGDSFSKGKVRDFSTSLEMTTEKSRRNRRDEFRLVILDLENNGRLCCVSLFVDCDIACHSGIIFHARKSVTNLRAVSRSSSVNRLPENHHRIVTKRGHSIGQGVKFRLIFFYKVLHLRVLVLHGEVRGEIASIQRAPADLSQFWRIPAVAAEQRNLD